ncbi:MAG: threonine dehydratase [Arcticibacterium sp.]
MVSDDEIIDVMQILYKHLNLAVEASEAVSFAALIKNKAYFKSKPIEVIITGGNLDDKLKTKYLGESYNKTFAG